MLSPSSPREKPLKIIRLFISAAIALSACTGYVSNPGGGTITPGPTNTDNITRECRPVAAPMRALTARQYNAAVTQLLADPSNPASVLQVPQSESKFDNHTDWVNADETLVRFYVSSAEQLATTAVANQAKVLACSNPKSADEDACLGQILDTFGRRAFRRTLMAEERTAMLGVFHTVRALQGASWNDGLSAVLQVLLQSPQFLYVTEVGVPVAQATRPTSRLTPLEVATKLSLLIWGSVPDDALLDAAELGQLETKAQIETQAKRLLADPKAKQGFLHFASQWLELDKLDSANKSATRFPTWTPAVAASARAELDGFISGTYLGGGGFRDLLLSRQTSVDAALGAIYGVDASAKTLPESRAGVLTRVGFLAGHAHPEETSPTLRGKAVRLRFLCEEIPPPPPNVNVTLPSVGGQSTLRQRLAAHVDAASACSGCHRFMDPIGFGFEGFDSIGTARTNEPNGLAIDNSGQILTGAGSQPFKGALELSTLLADSEQANRCYLTQTYRYAQGRSETSKDRCHLDTVVASLPAHASMADVVVGITTADSFLNREPIQ